MADIITQADIQSILETYNALGQRILGYRRRIQAGAFIEPGEFQAHDADEQPIDMEPTQFLNAYGLDIAPVGRRNELYLEKASEKAPRDLDWLTAANPESMYQLSFRTEQCDVEPLIDLSRSEFIALRHHLAELRGYQVPKETTHA